MSATSTGFSLLGATGQPALGLGKAVRRRQLLKEEHRTRTDRERLIPLRTVPTAALSPGEAQPSAGIEKKVTAHSCPFLSPSETLCSVAFMLAERFPEERLGCAKTKHAALGWR